MTSGPGDARQPLLAVEDLSIAFGSAAAPVVAVDRVGFTISPGETVGLVGESGSGKSLTALAILRLIPPRARILSGSIQLEGTDLLRLPEHRMPAIRGRDVAMIFQEPMSSLNPLMTIGEQIEESILLHDTTGPAARRARAVSLLGRVGIPDPASRLGAYPHQFSGGMRQRVMIAMALACNPRLLIADEPTTALDVTVQAQVLEVMKEIRASTGTAILLISHNLGLVAELCARVVVMYAGRVVESGAVRDIFHRPRHSYTRGLLEAVPRLSGGRRRLHQIPGNVPPPGTITAGCAFAPRCPDRREICDQQRPPSRRAPNGHEAACWADAEILP
jgi:oligopeptide/dipeptide ABC transporter ATP-binding protein